VSTLAVLRAATSLYDIAALLKYKHSSLSYIVYKIPAAEKYTIFDIPKKTGSVRRIEAPVPRLKVLQRHLSDVLCDCLREIEEKKEVYNKASHAFRKDCSIITNAEIHKSRRYILNVDLEDFFPSLNFGCVRGFFYEE
jgi:hypothetical protein